MTYSVMILGDAVGDVWGWAVRHGLPVVLFVGGLSLAPVVYRAVLRRTGGAR